MKKTYALLALCTLALSACGGQLESTTDGVAPAPATSAAAIPENSSAASSSSAIASETPSAASTSASATPSPTRTVTVTTDETASASPSTSTSASTDLTDAIQIPLQESQAGPKYDGYASIKTPTGNIGCSIQEDGKDGYCGVLSYMEDRKYPMGSMGSQTIYGWSIPLSGANNFKPQVKNDVPEYQVHSITAEYGNTYTYGDFACDSEENGLTCWNTTTGQGVFMNRDGYSPVTR